MWHWFLYITGADDTSGTWYGWWSGAGSDIGEYAVAAALFTHTYTTYQRHKCHVGKCHRIGLRRVPGTDHIVCHRHHPNDQPTHDQILNDHTAANPH